VLQKFAHLDIPDGVCLIFASIAGLSK